MAATPFLSRVVQFDDVSMSLMESPAAPTSIDYLNGQLVAHGFTHGRGLNLADLRGQDQQMVLKCLSNMLGQRLDDMRRAEQLSGKYKTLSYDHERLLEQHRAAKEAAAQAEREMETGKAKVESAQKRLEAEEAAHKKSKDDFQRLKMAMQYLRTTTANDVKRKEKEIEKMTERWSRIANEQVKLGAIGSGMVCANLLPEQVASEKKTDIWEAALAESEAARLRLLKENDALRDVIVACANALVSLHHSTLEAINKVELEEPELILSDVLFLSDPGSTQAETAQNKLRELFANLREVLSQVSSIGKSRRQSLKQREEDAHQIMALQQANVALQAQLEEAQAAMRAQGQELLEQFVTDARFAAGQRYAADISTDLIGTPDKAAVLSELESQRQRLEDEREKHTEAALALGREKAALEAERLQFLEEKRAFMVQSILDDLPPTPDASGKAQPEPVKSVEEPKPAVVPQSSLSQPHVPSTQSIVTQDIKIASVVPALQQPPALDMERVAVGTSTTPTTEEELSPTSPTEQRSNTKPTIRAPAVPPRFRMQKTPKRRIHPQARSAHKYSPAVPSPLSRMIQATESPPSSPESKAQRAASRPPVIAEEDESDQGHEDIKVFEEIKAVAEEIEVVAVDKPVEPRAGSLSPLSRIMNMGLSPAIAPTLAISSFPGLLGTGSLTQNLAKSRQPIKGFGDMPGGFQLGTAIDPQSSTSNSAPVVPKKAKATTITKQRLPPPPKKVFGENHPRTSKESTSSSGSAPSTSDGRSSAASNKKSTTSAVPRVRGKATAPPTDKENVKKPAPTKPVVTRKPVSVVTRPAAPKAAPAIKKGTAPARSAPTRLKT
ncbi:SubName: Full=Uncharacterized protein {ECO:0000313/EMBL:CCA68032.1} [Serendipita indica DSM 11827]|nr:SubName: Full=Uncharacterized protein {ECO:0000313/EMBL:CCA68032.1} [Serendipita indica DSM 11827]